MSRDDGPSLNQTPHLELAAKEHVPVEVLGDLGRDLRERGARDCLGRRCGRRGRDGARDRGGGRGRRRRGRRGASLARGGDGHGGPGAGGAGALLGCGGSGRARGDDDARASGLGCEHSGAASFSRKRGPLFLSFSFLRGQRRGSTRRCGEGAKKGSGVPKRSSSSQRGKERICGARRSEKEAEAKREALFSLLRSFFFPPTSNSLGRA